MRDRANINTNLWTDQDWRDVPKSAKYLYLLLLTHPTLNYAGVADWRPARLAAMSPDDTADDVRADAEALQEARFIFVDDDTEEVLIRSFLRHDGLLKQPKLSISMVNAFGAIASKQIREVVVHELQRLLNEFPDWAAFGQEKVQALTKLEGTDMAEFTQGFTPSFTPELTLTGGQADPLHTSTATTTATSSKEDTPSIEDEFIEWYLVYPRKEDKGHAKKAFKAARKKASLETLIAGAQRYATEKQDEPKKFMAYPATWLNGERWEDETPTLAVVNSPWSKDFHK